MIGLERMLNPHTDLRLLLQTYLKQCQTRQKPHNVDFCKFRLQMKAVVAEC